MEVTVPEVALASILQTSHGIKPPRRVLSLGFTPYTVRPEDNEALIQPYTNGVTVLPSATDNPGLTVLVVNSGAAGNSEIIVRPDPADRIGGSIGAVNLAGAAGKGLVNTLATQLTGDYVELCSIGGGDWTIIGGIGVWALEL